MSQVAYTVFNSLFLLACLVSNGLFMVVILVSPRLCRPTNYLLLYRSAPQFLFALCAISVGINADAERFTTGVCNMQTFFTTLALVVILHSNLALNLERALKYWKPSKQAQVFSRMTTLMLLVGLSLFDVVIALLPPIGWVASSYFETMLGCDYSLEINVSYLHFLTIVVYAPAFLGLCSSLPLWIVKQMKYYKEGGIMETREDVAPESYSTRLKVANRIIKLRKYTSDAHEGAAIVKDEDSSDDDVEYERERGHYRVRREYHYKPKYMAHSLVIFILSGLDLVFLLPLFFTTYVRTYTFDSAQDPSQGAYVAVLVLSRIPCFLPLIVMAAVSPDFRHEFRFTLIRLKSKWRQCRKAKDRDESEQLG